MQSPEELEKAIDNWFSRYGSQGAFLPSELITPLALFVQSYGAACAAEMRERAAKTASDWGGSKDDPGISATEFDRRYGIHPDLTAAIRALPTDPPV